MDKKTFIRELEQSLSVLQEDELRDIISEYEQHIDMKVQSGLSEEEAIADFGSAAELTEEILEAYHVRADYALEQSGKYRRERIFAPNRETGAEKGRELLHQTGEVCAKTGQTTMRGLCRAGALLKNGAKKLACQLKRPFAFAKRRWNEWNVEREQEREGEQLGETDGVSIRKRRGTGFVSTAFSMLKALCVCVLRAAAGALHLCRNLCFGGIFLFCAGTGVCCLFGMGVLVVLWLQGYPLMGVTIACLGLNLCLFAAAGLSATFVTGRKRAEKREVRAEADYE